MVNSLHFLDEIVLHKGLQSEIRAILKLAQFFNPIIEHLIILPRLVYN